ncbi:NupC/NupG family nucleoside CNT transporter [Thermoleptolyngbya sichuanensis A183]|uniref:NupC/NupG family nucleoside CNT transporter n=1 Tax=Thermoleptolyngbya sichuanensis A183 TaxID=2737172 RepID=A0A6M8BLQ2_9CYAN|nr:MULTISPECIES: nucleoside transporter C-terminal domain-containing protein [Thermoleptolyngbya]MDG2616340.1 nucleoside transporter C-terminal domain-containing protein [Thermoleptolyngbya sichuanensis XZ-Cy5]QKD83205.1 NupC/NupG family nucleoside CNT transporter [Thermoleptolyngbya sichuanensis A183]
MERAISLIGILIFFGLAYLFSVNRRAINWRTVTIGFLLQFLMGLFVLKLPIGYQIFKFIGDLVTGFLNFADAGAEFVFGADFREHFFAFKVMPTVIFFSGVIGLLYYLGVMQKIVGAIAGLMRRTMRTSGPETTSCAANIFIGQTEAPLMIKPFVGRVTLSELHAIMTGGFATVAGGVLAAYISFGINPEQLIAASVMNAPGALAMSKVFFPQTGKFSYDSVLDEELKEDEIARKEAGEEEVLIPPEAASTAKDPIGAIADGAIQGIQLVLAIMAILIAFLALIAAINAFLGWLGGLIGVPQLSMEFLLSYLLFPLAFIMGVPIADCANVAVFLGKKIILNEFIAYTDLAEAISNSAIGARAATIATFALCGFANLGSIGQQIGVIGGMVPSRRDDVARLGVRAMIAGSFTNFVSAAIAGLLT